MGRCVERPLAAVVSSAEERSFLERRVHRRRVARGMSDCRRIVLRCADGLMSKAVAVELGAHDRTVGKWRRRFLKDRVEGLSDAPHSGHPRSMEDARAGEVVKRTLETSPHDATHRSIRSMAREAELSHTTARRIRKAFGLQPHRSEALELSGGPLFVDKARYVAGIHPYPSPPGRALALCVDEKNRGQALDREQPVLPITPGKPERRAHACVRTGRRRRSPRSTPQRASSSANGASATGRGSSLIFSRRSTPVSP